MMSKEYWTSAEVVEIFEVDERFLAELEEEEVLCPLSREDQPAKLEVLGKIRALLEPVGATVVALVKLLIDEMGVNLAGAEIILRMRQSIYEMRRQFDDILEDLAGRLREALEEKG